METEIYVITHKAFTPPEDPIYIPLQVGCDKNPPLEYLRDNTGDNISGKNDRYSELTGLYWLWKNSSFTGNIGINHYRRYFVKDGLRLLDETDYNSILKDYDIITSTAMKAKRSYRDFYISEHDPEQLVLLEQAFRELYPEDLGVYNECMEGSLFYFGNLFVMKRAEFDIYCEWLFSLLSYVERRLDISMYDEYHRRVFGFLSEQLLMVWVRKRGLNPYECKVGLMGDKAETSELKLAMAQLIKMEQIEQAYRMYYEILKLRPDLIRDHSDLSGDLLVIDHLLFIMLEEKRYNTPGLLAYSHRLSELIDHYKKCEDCLVGSLSGTNEAGEYLESTGVSEAMIRFILSR